jgi:hypothetical protein
MRRIERAIHRQWRALQQQPRDVVREKAGTNGDTNRWQELRDPKLSTI